MANSTSRKAVMTLFSSPTCAYCHRARIVLIEKDVTHDIEYVDPNQPPEDLLELNPSIVLPTLVDRDLVLYDSRIIMEYLDERFPHPPLYPMDPVSRARARMLIHRFEAEWYGLMAEIESAPDKKAAKARKALKDSLLTLAPTFSAKPYFFSDEFSLIDCVLAPLLWRLPVLGIELPATGDAIKSYAERMFNRPSFRASLTEQEKEMVDSAGSH